MNVSLSALSIPDLRAQFGDRAIAPGDSGYDEARAVFYGGFDRHPAVIIRAADASDVASVIGLARATGLELAVRAAATATPGTARPKAGSSSTCAS